MSSKQSCSFDLINGLSIRLMATRLQMFWAWYKALSMYSSAGRLCIEAHCRSINAKLEGRRVKVSKAGNIEAMWCCQDRPNKAITSTYAKIKEELNQRAHQLKCLMGLNRYDEIIAKTKFRLYLTAILIHSYFLHVNLTYHCFWIILTAHNPPRFFKAPQSWLLWQSSKDWVNWLEGLWLWEG